MMETDSFQIITDGENLQLINLEGESLEPSASNSEETPPTPTAPTQQSSSPTKKQQVTQTKTTRFPLARVKNIMKMDPDCGMIGSDAVFLVTKATEMFLEFLAEETGKQLGKRKTVMKRDVDVVIETVPELCFLDGALD